MSIDPPDTICLADPDSHINIFNFKERQKTYSGNGNIASPLVIDDERKPCSCEKCGQQFTQVWQLQKHSTLCSRQKPEVHFDSFFQSGLLNSSSLKTTKGKRFSCQVCNKTLKSKDTLKQHTRLHGKGHPYKCDECGMQFKTSQHLYIYRKRYHTENPSQPKISNVETPTTKCAKINTKGKRSFICRQCGKAFASIYKRKIHMQTHTGECPFKCSECGNAFTEKESLNHHMSIHTGHYPFTCDHPKCKYTCATKAHLNSHECREHTGERLFSRDQPNCTRKYTTNSMLTHHKQTKHIEKLFCGSCCGQTCDECTNCNLQMLKHTARCQFKCYQPRCNRRFHSTQVENDNSYHQQNHIEDRLYKNNNGKNKNAANLQPEYRTAKKSKKSPHHCQVCNKKFKSKRGMFGHSQIHTKEQPNKWIICHKSCVLQADMKSHTLIHHDDIPENCTYQRKILSVAVPSKNFPEAIDSVSDEASQTWFKPIDDRVRCNTNVNHMGSESLRKPKQCTNTVSCIDVEIHLHDGNDITCSVNHTYPESVQPITEPNVLANIHLESAPEILLPATTEYNSALIKQTRMTDQQINNSALLTNDLEKFKSQVNPLPDSGKSTTSLVKQTDDQTILSVADLIYLYDMNLQTLSPFCHITESSTGIVKLPEWQSPQLCNTDSQVPGILSDPKSGTHLGAIVDQQKVQSLLEPIDLENLNTQVRRGNRPPVIRPCKTSLLKQMKDQTQHSVAEIIRLYDMNLETQTNPPSPRREGSQGIEKEQIALQSSQFEKDQSDFGNTSLLTSQTNCRISNAECSTNLKEYSNHQILHSKAEETDLNKINLEPSRKHPAHTNRESNSSFERQIYDQDLQHVVAVTDSDSDFQTSCLPDANKKQISRFVEPIRDQNVQSVVEVIDLDNDDLQTKISPKNPEPTCAEHLHYETFPPAINSNKSHLNTCRSNPIRNNTETKSNLILQMDDLKLQSTIPPSAFNEMSLKLSQTNLLKSSLLTPVYSQNTDFVNQMNGSNTSLQLFPETAAVESCTSLVKNCDIRKMSTTKDKDYLNLLQTSEAEPKNIARIKNSMKSATQINQAPQTVEKQVRCTNDVQTIAAKHVFKQDGDARLVQQASLKIAQIILERVDATAPLSQLTTKDIKYDAVKSAEYTEPLSNQQKLYSPTFHTNSTISHPSDNRNTVFRYKKGKILEKKKTSFCGECGLSFIHPKSLRIHNFKHTGKYPFWCDQPNCSFKCHARPLLEDHKRSKHTGERPYICNACGKSFTSITGLKSHSLRHAKVCAYV